jgi:hypothetical protein
MMLLAKASHCVSCTTIYTSTRRRESRAAPGRSQSSLRVVAPNDVVFFRTAVFFTGSGWSHAAWVPETWLMMFCARYSHLDFDQVRVPCANTGRLSEMGVLPSAPSCSIPLYSTFHLGRINIDLTVSSDSLPMVQNDTLRGR